MAQAHRGNPIMTLWCPANGCASHLFRRALKRTQLIVKRAGSPDSINSIAWGWRAVNGQKVSDLRPMGKHLARQRIMNENI